MRQLCGFLREPLLASPVLLPHRSDVTSSQTTTRAQELPVSLQRKKEDFTVAFVNAPVQMKLVLHTMRRVCSHLLASGNDASPGGLTTFLGSRVHGDPEVVDRLMGVSV